MRSQDVVVGYDGSEPAGAAVRWAAAEAARRNVPLRVLTAYHVPLRSTRFGGYGDLQQMAADQCEQQVKDAVTLAQEVQPGIEVTGSIVLGDPAVELVSAGAGASVVVVGNRGRGGFASLLVGSVSQRVAAHAQVPVVVVRGRADAAAGPVVVGVDDSPTAERVVEAAFDEASRREVKLVAVHTFAVAVPPNAGTVPLPYDEAGARDDATERLAQEIGAWRDKYPTVQVETIVGRGSPAAALAELSATAGLVVVGSHARSTLTGTVLGSVGFQLLHHAGCPVYIVRTR